MSKLLGEFSKEHAPEERKQTADAIKVKRAEREARQREYADRQKYLEETSTDHERAMAETISGLEQLSAQIEKLNSTMMGKVFNIMKIKKVRADILTGKKTYEELLKLRDENLAEQTSLQQIRSQKEFAHQEETAALLDNFYKYLTERWENSEYSREDLKRYFSEEQLASLSVEDYGILLKRFPGEMVTHVTRHGIRDHHGMFEHSTGVGEFHSSFTSLLADGRLRSALGVALTEHEKEKAVAKMLELQDCKTRQQALSNLEKRAGEHGTYSDFSAVHLATEAALDQYYGAEQGNEIFVAYPSAHIASQYQFSNRLDYGDRSKSNDQFVWSNELRGMDLNAGLIFIPAGARVNAETGSRYELDANKPPIRDTHHKTTLENFASSKEFDTFAEAVEKIPSNRRTTIDIAYFEQQLVDTFGIADKRLQAAILGQFTLHNLRRAKGDLKKIAIVIENTLTDGGMLYQEAADTIPSKDFWEDYFLKHPEQKPSKVVYYSETDPTEALMRWKSNQGLKNKAKDENLGFPEHRIEKNSEGAKVGIHAFNWIGKKIIDERWPSYGSLTRPNRDEIQIVGHEELDY